MTLIPRHAEVLAPYWNEFERVSEYKVILGGNLQGVCLTTKTGAKPVGAIFRSPTSTGSVVCLPEIDFAPDSFFREREGKRYWTNEAKSFADRLTSSFVALDKALHSSAEVTPEPGWASDPAFALAKERALRTQLLEAERLVEEAQKQKEQTIEHLQDAGRLRSLLFEKGKPLERAIIEALGILGFTAAPYKTTDSEFDVVFECAEGRLLGEAEGKDNKAVNVDKLRQLAMNIHEDLLREEVSTPAKAVLFGNGFRLTVPRDREVQFTDKCIKAAVSSSTALVTTSDLHKAALFIADHGDAGFAKACRETIISCSGIIKFPPVPAEAPADITESVSERKMG